MYPEWVLKHKIKTPISVKENGASSIICQLGEDIIQKL